MGTIKKAPVRLKDSENVFRMLDFICTNPECGDKEPYIFEALACFCPHSEQPREKCPKCGQWCDRAQNQKPIGKHLSWAMWRAELEG